MAGFYDARSLAEFVQLLREEQGLSFDQLAEKTGVGKSTLHRIESEGWIPKDYILKKLSDYAMVADDWLYDLAHPERHRLARFSKTSILVADLLEQLPEDLQKAKLAEMRAFVESYKRQHITKTN